MFSMICLWYDFTLILHCNSIIGGWSNISIATIRWTIGLNNPYCWRVLPLPSPPWRMIRLTVSPVQVLSMTPPDVWPATGRTPTHGIGPIAYSPWAGSAYMYDGMSFRLSQTVSSIVTQYLNDTQPRLVQVLSQKTGTNMDRYVHSRTGIHV